MTNQIASISQGSHTVRIIDQDGLFYSLHIINNGETVIRSAHHSTEKGARRWAQKELAA